MKTKKYLMPAQKTELVRLHDTGRFTLPELAEKFDISESAARKHVNAAKANGDKPDHANDLITLGAMVQDARRLATKLGYTLTLTKD